MTDDELRRLQLDKLDELEKRAEELIDRPHYHVHEGQPVRDPLTGDPLRDDGALLRGLDVALGVLKLRAQLVGLDAPQRHHLVDGDGNTIDITRLIPILLRFGRVIEDD